VTYVLHYVSEDFPELGTWTIYAEEYASFEDEEPIPGSGRVVESGFASEGDADTRAVVLQKTANG
jgi:hypothetical protein